MKEKFEFHLETIIKQLFKQVVMTSILFIIFTGMAAIALYFNRIILVVIGFLFAILFLSLTLIDLVHYLSNKKSFSNFNENKEIISKKLNHQYRIYISRNKGAAKYLWRYIYSTIITHYEVAMETLRIEEQIKI